MVKLENVELQAIFELGNAEMYAILQWKNRASFI